LLKAGRSKSPMEILRDAGVDLQSSEAYDIAFGKFDRAVDELTALS
jgi:oligoendopeptidase F